MTLLQALLICRLADLLPRLHILGRLLRFPQLFVPLATEMQSYDAAVARQVRDVVCCVYLSGVEDPRQEHRADVRQNKSDAGLKLFAEWDVLDAGDGAQCHSVGLQPRVPLRRRFLRLVQIHQDAPFEASEGGIFENTKPTQR